jgi:LacI family transcriptional regulator
MKTKRVLLYIWTGGSFGRGILAGISRYMKTAAPWEFILEYNFAVVLKHLSSQVNGFIGNISSVHEVEHLDQLGIKHVNISSRVTGIPAPAVFPDNEIVGKLAAEHLISKGFRRFAYCGFAGHGYSIAREKGFVGLLQKTGADCAVYAPPPSLDKDSPWDVQTVHLAQWLKSLPKPCGLLACNDTRAWQILEICRNHDINIPEELAVIGVDNDELLCNLIHPNISSVELSTERIGYEAAVLLQHLMKGGKPSAQPILIPPVGVVQRRSTDVLAIEDAEVAAAVRFIHEKNGAGISIGQIAEAAGAARRSLQKKFRKFTGRTMETEIRIARLNRAQTLLAETDLPMPKVAEACGFSYAEHLSGTFKKHLGLTPTQYRKKYRLR